MDFKLQTGFGNHCASEALPGALPIGQNSPQKPPYGLIPELLSGTAFTAPRANNQKSWLYRIRPSVMQSSYQKCNDFSSWLSAPFGDENLTPEQLRWDPLPMPEKPTTFIEGVMSFGANGSAAMRSGSAIHQYLCNRDMDETFFVNADGELLIVPQEGALIVQTELGHFLVEPLEIAVIPRGVKFQIKLQKDQGRGYILENYGQAFELPELGPIGSNGLANPRDFEYPTASYVDKNQECQLVTKFGGQFFTTQLGHHPFDVVAWHGNLSPYRYDLKRFNTINTVSFDHPDPSIFTVLTSPTAHKGCANVDFVIFPPRWMVAENTFRPPYFHRNVMSEFMGLIQGVYDAKPAGGFDPGGASLHSCMSPHGPEAAAYDQATDAELKPEYISGATAFMFESSYIYKPSSLAINHKALQKNYSACWQGIKPRFNSQKR